MQRVKIPSTRLVRSGNEREYLYVERPIPFKRRGQAGRLLHAMANYTVVDSDFHWYDMKRDGGKVEATGDLKNDVEYFG